MKTRLLWVVSLGLLISVIALFATSTPISIPRNEKNLKTVAPAAAQLSVPAAKALEAPSNGVLSGADEAAISKAISNGKEIQKLQDEIRAAKSAGHAPSADVYRRLRELRPPAPRRGPGHLDQGGEACASATVISTIPYSDFGTTAGYQDDYDIVDCDGPSTSPDVVYEFTPAADGDYHISLCGSSYDTRLFVYANTCSGTPIVCNDDGPNCWPSSDIPSVTLTGGTPYFIILDGWGGDFGDYAFFIEPAVPAPQGDNCDNPFVIPSLPFNVQNQSTCGFAHDYSNTCAIFGEGPDVVYRFTLTTPTAMEVVLNAHPATEGMMPDYVWPTILLSDHCPPDWNCIANAWSTLADVLYLPTDVLPAGDYYVVISSEIWYHPCFEYDLTVRPRAQCDIVSQPGDVNEVAEPFPVPGTFSINDPDGGCNNADPYSPQYQDISASQTIFGHTFAYTDSITSALKADMDWYRLEATTPVNLTCTYVGECMLRVRLITPPCPGVIEFNGPPATPCYSGSFTQCLEPGEYYIRIERSGPMTAPDAQPYDYRATFTLGTCQLPIGRCCYAETCANNTHPECDALYGTWFAGLTCDTPCPNLPPNDDCHNAGTPANLPATFTGDNTNATNDCPLYEGDPQVWHVFVNPEMQDIQVDYCGTQNFSSFNGYLYQGCPCATRVFIDAVDWGYCAPSTFTGLWRNLPAGTWYISVTMYNPNSIGPYTIHVTAVSSAPPANDDCATATPIVLVPNGSVAMTGTTMNANVSCTDICEEDSLNYSSTGGDVFYSLTLTECRRIAMALGTSDMHIAIYQGANQCCVSPAFLCNDEDADFRPLPWWDVAEQHPGNQCSYVAASLDPGVYLIRVAKYATEIGAYTLTVYDNGPCQCIPPVANDVSAYCDGNTINLRWSTDAASASRGTYRLYSNTNDMPVGDPSWTVVADSIAPVVGVHHLYYSGSFAGNDRTFYYVTGLCYDGPSLRASSKSER